MDRRHFIRSGAMFVGAAMLAGRVEPTEIRRLATTAGRSDGGLQAIRILGIGGAGCNVVEQLSDRHDLPRPLRVGRIGETRPLELRLDGDLDAGLSGVDLERLSMAVASAELTIVVAGLGGATGSYVAPRLAVQARRSGGRCVEVYCLPLSCEGEERQARSLRVLTGHDRATDQVRLFSHDESQADAPLAVILARTNAAMTAAVITALSEFHNAKQQP